jgi:electron transfer flavoprotein alpha/beta subunit
MSERAPLVFALLDEADDLGLVTVGRGLGDVIAISARPPTGEATDDQLLSDAAALGAARLVLIADAVLAGVDYLAIAHVLACAVRHFCEARSDAPIIVLSGDRGRGAVGPAVAERLAVPHLCAAYQVALVDGRLLVDRVCGAELRRWVGAPPVVLACFLPTAAPPASAPSSKPPAIERVELETLQITAPELEYRQRFSPVDGVGPRPRPHVVSNIEHLGERLARDGLWPLPSAASGSGR